MRLAARHPRSIVVVVTILAVAVMAALVLFAVGARVADRPHTRAMPNVIGLPVGDARDLLEEGGAVRIRTEPAGYGQPGIVQRVSGYEFDGTYTSRSEITLVVGGS